MEKKNELEEINDKDKIINLTILKALRQKESKEIVISLINKKK